MKRCRLIKQVLFVLLLSTFGFLGCKKLDVYSVNAPADIQSRIDSIAAENGNVEAGDTTYLEITTPTVGAEDNSSEWWTAFSDIFHIPTGQRLVLEFINHSSGDDNWNNWNLVVTNNVDSRESDDYKEYFVLRSDAYGWEGDMGDEGYPFDADMISNNYQDIDGDGDVWNDFRETMQGAYVTMEVDHSTTGYVFVTATAVGKDSVVLIEKYKQPVSTTDDISAFLSCDHSHFDMKKAYLLPSKVTALEDQDPVSLTIKDAPASIELGNEDFWGNASAVVTFADGSSTEVDTADLTFDVIPDLTTTGEKNVIVSYNKTKQGNYTQAVIGSYKIEVTNVIESISASDIDYYYFNNNDIHFQPVGVVVTAKYADGTTATLDTSDIEFNYPALVSPLDGTQKVEVTYKGTSDTLTTTSTVTFIKGIAQVGLNDFSTAWWTAFSDEYTVPSGESKTISLYCYSSNEQNWYSPSVVLTETNDLDDNKAVVRMDNFGFGSGYDNIATATSDWDFDTFASNISGSKIDITVKNNGDNTAEVYYDVTYANGEKYFQKYEGIAIQSADLNFALVTEGSYLIIVN